ncbi:hypothetical protein BDW74DRAFT_190010 [Aspergillus multicolor]|uniref:GMC family oxidoreductase n=1 Tax=Aspergillus multicolor TaxID=41759 RepID=UPI003CCD5D87
MSAYDPTPQIDIQPHLVSNPHNVANKSYDYIIAGGGLTGLTIAAQLSSNPNISVLIIEKGFYESADGPIIEDATSYSEAFGSSVDQNYLTVSQIDNKTHNIKAGRGLGGSTLINGQSWTRPDKVQIDAWETVFGNEGWNWGSLVGYMNRAEKARPLTAEQVAAGHHFEPGCHGFNGPVDVGPRDTGEEWSPLIQALMNTISAWGVPTKVDFNCGHPRGVSMIPNNLHEDQAESGVLTGQMVGRILFDTNSFELRAIGVNFKTHKSLNFNVYANREVLLAAGSTISPLILEYSGIGLETVLNRANITQLIALPVGLNMQDQTTTSVTARTRPAGNGQGQAVYYANITELFGGDTAHVRNLLSTKLDNWANQTVSNGGFHNATALKIQYETYREWILNEDVALAELFLDTSGQIKIETWDLPPFTRGSVHILSSDPYLLHYANDPKYYLNELDVLVQTAATNLARNLQSTGGMASYFNGEITPGPDIPPNASLENWKDYVTTNFRPNYHAIGTCAMMKRELGGIVDSKARVYGTQGLRVVDGSIAPMQMSPHVMAAFYGMALRIADAVLEEYEAT